MVLDYLVKNGNEIVVKHCRSKISFLQKLKDFQFNDKDGIDQGINGKLLIRMV